MEGTISTIDEILEYESDNEVNAGVDDVRSDVVETILYRRALSFAQAEMENGRPMSNHLLRSMHQLLLSFGRVLQNRRGHSRSSKTTLATSEQE